MLILLPSPFSRSGWGVSQWTPMPHPNRASDAANQRRYGLDSKLKGRSKYAREIGRKIGGVGNKMQSLVGAMSHSPNWMYIAAGCAFVGGARVGGRRCTLAGRGNSFPFFVIFLSRLAASEGPLLEPLHRSCAPPPSRVS